MFRKCLAAAMLAAILSGCGGGSEAPPAAGEPMRATRVTTSPEIAEQVLNAVEAAHPQYFPSRQATQSFAPFLYRYYPETRMYLGLVAQTSSFYTFNGVYAAGGPFGILDNPTRIGKLTDFITIGGCFDLDLFDTQGTRMTVAYNYMGASAGTETEQTTVGGMTTFEGHRARETTIVRNGTVSGPGGFMYTSTDLFYGARTGAFEVTQYGSSSALTATTANGTLSSSSRTVMSPPYVDARHALARGASTTATQSGATTTTTNGTAAAPEPFSSTITTKYVGQESVTVPAGTFAACKFEVSHDASPEVATHWLIAGKGILVKTVESGQTVLEATSVTLNGARL
jgi:hypothetical protein